MTMIMLNAIYVADNGTVFSFEYVESTRMIEVNVVKSTRMIGVDIVKHPHLTILDVAPEDSTKEMNSFMDSWNQANPGKPRITVDPAVEERLRLMST